jgi:hypothetical protein
MAGLNFYDVEFTSTFGYDGRALVQANSRDEAEQLIKRALQDRNYSITSGDVYDIELLKPLKISNILLLGING